MIPVDASHILYHFIESLIQLNLGFPPEFLFCASLPSPSPTGSRDVWLSLARIVLRQRHEHDFALAAGLLDDLLRELLHGELHRIAEVEGSGHAVLLHHEDHSLHGSRPSHPR